MNENRNAELILKDIKQIVGCKGYIYALCMTLFEDFHYDIEKVHEIDFRNRLDINEASLLIGFLIQNKLDFSIPNSPKYLIHFAQSSWLIIIHLATKNQVKLTKVLL